MSVQLQTNSVKVSAKGQVVIPEAIRKKYGWKTGMRVMIEEAGIKKVTIRKKPLKQSLGEKYRGAMKGRGPSMKQYLKWKKEQIEREDRFVR